MDRPRLDDLVGLAGEVDALEVAAEVRRLEEGDLVVVVHPRRGRLLAAAEDHPAVVDEHPADVREVVADVEPLERLAGVGRPPQAALADRVAEAEVL